MKYIRKVSVGTDYKNAMHYIVGQEVLGGYYVINDISQEKTGIPFGLKKMEKSLNGKRYPMFH